MRRCFLIGMILLLVGSYVYSAVPCKINYQGRLIKDNVPVDGTVEMEFKIYDTQDVGTGTKLWGSGKVNVPVHNGLFRYVIGSGGTDLSGIPWTAGQALYLEVVIDGETLSPREALSAYPYAINSHLLEGKTTDYFINTSAEMQTKEGGLNIMGNVGIGTTSPGSYLPNRLVLADPGYPGLSIVSSPSSFGYISFADGTSGDQRYRGSIRYYHGNDSLFFGAGGQEEIMTLRNGNVGIGTTSPGAKLHIGGTPGTDGIMFPDGTLQTTAGGSQSVQVVGTTNIQVGSSWTDMTDMMINMNTTGGNVLLMFSGNIHASGNDDARAILRFNVDGNSRHNMAAEAGDGGWQEAFAMHWLEISLPAGSHTFKVQWREDDATVYQDGATYPRVFTVIELL